MAAFHIVVIGAGALGLASALELSERGVAVTVIEADTVAGGSTGRSVGVVGTQHVTALDVALRAYGLRRIQSWSARGLFRARHARAGDPRLAAAKSAR